MAIILRIWEIELDDPKDHIATDWEIATKINFEKDSIILSSYEDYENVRVIGFNEVLDPNKKYFARARALLNGEGKSGKGYNKWGNVDIFQPEIIHGITDEDPMPSRISIPTITTNSPTTNHDSTLFKIYIAGFSVVGTATHKATSWFIEDVNNLVVWSSINDDINKTNIVLNDFILRSNRIYRIKAVFHSNTNDVSQISTKTIHVNGGNEIDVTTYLDNLNPCIDNTITIANMKGLNYVYWEIVSINEGRYVEVIWRATTDTYKVILPAKTLKGKTRYMLRVKTNIGDSFKYIAFITGEANCDLVDAKYERPVIENIDLLKDETDKI